MPSPPKPWEVNSGSAIASTPVVSNMSETTTTTTTAGIPTVPNRPSTMTNTMGTMGMNGMNSGYGGYGTTGGYGTGGYGSSYGTGGYGTSRYGGMSSYGGYGGMSSYGGYGGMSSYGGSYGGMGGMGYGGYGGMNRFGNGMYGPDGMPEDSLTQRMEAGTRATFDVIQSIVGAFGGFAQMLDSTYMATHSSFMAMVGVAEQFGNLKLYLGGIFSIFAWIRWIKRLMYRLTGRAIPPELLPPAEETENNTTEEGGAEALQITENGEVTASTTTTSESEPTEQQVTRVSRKRPIIIFLALVTGLPYIMYKLIQRSNQLRQQQQRMMIPQYGGPPPEAARVIHDFVAENPIELTLRRGETIHVLSKVDPATGAPCDWWQGRSANGTIGIFPANYVQINPSF